MADQLTTVGDATAREPESTLRGRLEEVSQFADLVEASDPPDLVCHVGSEEVLHLVTLVEVTGGKDDGVELFDPAVGELHSL